MGFSSDFFNPENNNYILTYNSAFIGTDAIFIEYNDILRCIEFSLLQVLRTSDIFYQLFDAEEIKTLSDGELYAWYVNRKHRNIFKNIKISDYMKQQYFENNIEKENEWKDSFVYEEIDELEDLLTLSNKLKFYEVLEYLSSIDIVKKIYIYTDSFSSLISNEIESNFDENKVIYVSGNFIDIINENKITSNTTFVFSDITKINLLKEVGILNLSTILIGEKYRYNYNDDESIKVDIEKLIETDLMKIFFYPAIEFMENENQISFYNDDISDDELEDMSYDEMLEMLHNSNNASITEIEEVEMDDFEEYVNDMDYENE